MTDFMVDIETISTKPNAAIVAIGACEFDMETGETGREFYTNIKWDSNLNYNRDVDLNTIQWWMKQSDGARRALFDEPQESLPTAMMKFALFYDGCGNLPIWSHASFDEQILRNAFEVLRITCPWHHRDVRDIRTLIGMLPKSVLDGIRSETLRLGDHHNALHDALYQCGYVSKGVHWQRYLNGSV